MTATLAIDGGTPVRREPFPPRIQIGEEELEVVTRILRESMTGKERLRRYAGTHTEALEHEMAEFYGVKFGQASTSGTAAVHLAVAAVDLEPGDEVITSPITDQGTVIPILYQNAIPIFADVDPETLNIDPQSVAERISDRTRAIIAVHLAGQPADMDPLVEIARKHDLFLIEDLSQAHGAKYKGRMVGSIGHIAAISLMAGKHTTTGGEGGITITNDERLYERMRSFADKGRSFPDKINFLFLGMNYRITELQAAIGRIQLKKLPAIIDRRKRFCEHLRERISPLKTFKFWKIIADVDPVWWFIFLHVDFERLQVNRDRLVETLKAEGIPVGRYYEVLYQQPWIKERRTYGRSECPWVCQQFYGKKVDYTGSCPKAEKAIEEHLTLVVHEGYTDREVEDIALALEKVEANYL